MSRCGTAIMAHIDAGVSRRNALVLAGKDWRNIQEQDRGIKSAVTIGKLSDS